MRVFENLEPKEVFYYFEDICSIPHGSGNTQKISDYCVNFAKEHGLNYRQEECGNVVIWKDATSGYEQADTVILQGHMDMVAVKDADCPLDLEKDGLIPEVDGAWIQAKGSSLGGDDGIAVAYALAILAADDIPHPALEVVFTVGEEVGLVGATALDTSDLKGKILMNIDSEDDGIFLIGCAGAATVAFAQGGDFVGGLDGGNFKKGLLRKAMNSLFCRTDRPIDFRGTMNEDVTTYTTLGSRGRLFFTLCNMCVIQIPTQSLDGGMTESYLETGTYVKTFYSVMAMPSCIKVSMMYTKHKRIHHRIDWECCVPKIINEKYRKEVR